MTIMHLALKIRQVANNSLRSIDFSALNFRNLMCMVFGMKFRYSKFDVKIGFYEIFETDVSLFSDIESGQSDWAYTAYTPYTVEVWMYEINNESIRYL